MSHDALSDLLRCIRLRGAVFFHIDCAGAWVTESPPTSRIAARIMPDSEHVMAYHVVLTGSGWAGIAGERPVRVEAGDVVVFPHGDAHCIAGAAGLRAPAAAGYLSEPLPSQLPFMVRQEGARRRASAGDPAGGSAATLLCGFLGCETRPFNPLISALPPMIHARAAQFSDHSWSAQLARLAAAEARSKRPGGEAVLERMSEMMFVDVLRQHLERIPQEHTGWLAGLRDRHVGKVLGLIHARPGEAWTLDSLASHAGLSRSALHERFVQLMQQPPMQYLKCWRMQLASRLLSESSAKLAAIARDCGYESEAAFSRAFKHAVGLPPATWRRQRAAQAGHARA